MKYLCLFENYNSDNYDETFKSIRYIKDIIKTGDESKDDIKKLKELKDRLRRMCKPKNDKFKEDIRRDWFGIKIGDIVTLNDIEDIFEKNKLSLDISHLCGLLSDKYVLNYTDVKSGFDKYFVADSYEDSTHLEIVENYMGLIMDGVELPPIILSKDGNVLDGGHRMAAHNGLGRKKILSFIPYEKKKDKFPNLKNYNIDGFDVIMGKDAISNDHLTINMANPEDIWFHAKGVPGSHIIIRVKNNLPTIDVIRKVAYLAAKNSKSKDRATVVYCKAKFVKKGSGMKDGQVSVDYKNSYEIDIQI